MARVLGLWQRVAIAAVLSLLVTAAALVMALAAAGGYPCRGPGAVGAAGAR